MRTTDGASALRLVQAGLAALDEVDVVDVADQQVRDEIATLLVALNQLAAAIATRVGTFDARGLSECDGLRTTRSWLVAYGRMSQGAATAWLARGRMLRELPALAAAASRGSVSGEHLAKVGLLADRVGLTAVRDFDEILAQVSCAANPAETQKACERILAHVDPDGADPDPARDLERRDITFSRLGSMLYLRGRLDAEGGAALMTAVDALMRPPGPDDPRTGGQRRADALVDLARGALNSGRVPTIGGVRPHLGVLVTPGALATPPGRSLSSRLRGGTGAPISGGPQSSPAGDSRTADNGRRCSQPDRRDPLAQAGIPPGPEPPWLNWIGEVPAALAQRIACDCDVWRAVLDPATGLPLEVGRAHRTVPSWIRRALHARDRGCRWPGCDAPSAWTDAHHLVAWYLGGQTNIDNLLLLCRYHHGLVHEGQWTIDLDRTTGQVTVTRPDARKYDLGPSRPYVGPSRHTPGDVPEAT